MSQLNLWNEDKSHKQGSFYEYGQPIKSSVRPWMALQCILCHDKQCQGYAVDVYYCVVGCGVVQSLDVDVPCTECHENTKQLHKCLVGEGNTGPNDGVLVGTSIKFNNFIFAIFL